MTTAIRRMPRTIRRQVGMPTAQGLDVGSPQRETKNRPRACSSPAHFPFLIVYSAHTLHRPLLRPPYIHLPSPTGHTSYMGGGGGRRNGKFRNKGDESGHDNK